MGVQPDRDKGCCSNLITWLPLVFTEDRPSESQYSTFAMGEMIWKIKLGWNDLSRARCMKEVRGPWMEPKKVLETI